MSHTNLYGFFTEFPWSREAWQETENNTHNNTWSKIFENFHGAENNTHNNTQNTKQAAPMQTKTQNNTQYIISNGKEEQASQEEEDSLTSKTGEEETATARKKSQHRRRRRGRNRQWRGRRRKKKRRQCGGNADEKKNSQKKKFSLRGRRSVFRNEQWLVRTSHCAAFVLKDERHFYPFTHIAKCPSKNAGCPKQLPPEERQRCRPKSREPWNTIVATCMWRVAGACMYWESLLKYQGEWQIL